MTNPLTDRPWLAPPLDYLPAIGREKITWPNNAALAIIVYLNVEHFRYDLPSPVGLTPPQLSRTPDVINFAWREYGMRVGVWRIMQVLDKYQVKATVALNSEACRAYPSVVQECLARDWEILDHGVTNSVQMYGLEADVQRALIKESVATIKEFTGKTPRGWSGPGLSETFDTLQILWEEGFRYVAEWGICDDLPYPLKVGDGTMLAMPYPQETNDLPTFLWQQRTSDQALRQFVDQFDCLYEEGQKTGKALAIALHPYLTGVPHRIGVLDRLLEHIRSRERVWFARAEEVDEWYRARWLPDIAAKK